MQATVTALVLASPLFQAPLELARSVVEVLSEIVLLVGGFRKSGATPLAACEFENKLATLLRQLGQRIVAWTYNHLEPAETPKLLEFEGEFYRRGGMSPRRGVVWTLFGSITLIRRIYRHYYGTEAAVFPLEVNLGVEPGGATAALATRAAWLAAANTQEQTLEILKADHGVTCSVATLRKMIAATSASLSEHRHDAQCDRILALLQQADASRGDREIVLSVGRDGIFTPIRAKGPRQFQEAATATVAVYDRKGHRLGTVYFAQMPETLQPTLSRQLTSLIADALQRWQGPMPRLSYVTDAGSHAIEYFENTLRRMRHPRTGELLHWEWVVDFFHVSGHVSKLAEAIFGAGKEALAWARKMNRWFIAKPNGAFRVLHSAAALKEIRGLKGSQAAYRESYNYLRNRLAHVDYPDYRRRGLPIGSGVTEAACKLVFTQRFKQSGMAWSKEGAQTILNLRVLRLSGVWNFACEAYLRQKPTIPLHSRTNSQQPSIPAKFAA